MDMDRVMGATIIVLLVAGIAVSGVLLMSGPGEDGGAGKGASREAVLRSSGPLMGGDPALIKGFFSPPCEMVPLIGMCDVKVQLPGKTARGFVYPLGPVNLVAVVTDIGMVGCGAFDVAALEKFQYPAARVRPSKGDSIATIGDLLEGIVKDANGPAQARGVKIGMTGREALGKL
jgi:uncharacterized protein YunC (DUF1805 family)